MPPNPPLLIIHDPETRWIEANVWESDISRVRVGRPVDIWVDAFKTEYAGARTNPSGVGWYALIRRRRQKSLVCPRMRFFYVSA